MAENRYGDLLDKYPGRASVKEKAGHEEEIRARYGNLLDKYLDKATMDIEEKIRREEEAQARYGNLLDYARPDYRHFDCMMKSAEICSSIRGQREREYQEACQRRQERMERELREEKEHAEGVTAFAESVLARREAKRKAAEEAMAKEREEAEERKRYLDSVQYLVDAHSYGKEASERINKMMAYQAKKSREQEDQMAWLDSKENQRK